MTRRDALAGGLAATGSVLLVQNTTAQEQEAARAGTLELNTLDFTTAPNPVLFWNEVSLQMVAHDHSVDPGDARAPGPCATARALGLVHAVMADAVAAVLPVQYKPFLKTPAGPPQVGFPDAFIGGAAAQMLQHIYSTPAHAFFLGTERLRFLSAFEEAALEDWDKGLRFANDPDFLKHWDWEKVRAATVQRPAPYVVRPKGTTSIRSTRSEPLRCRLGRNQSARRQSR
jgi:hypothetical protein